MNQLWTLLVQSGSWGESHNKSERNINLFSEVRNIWTAGEEEEDHHHSLSLGSNLKTAQ